MPVVTDYTALLSGSYWNGIEAAGAPVIVTFSFPTSLPAYDASIAGFTAATDTSFQPFSAAEQAQALAAMGEWAAASGLIFIQAAAGQGDINFSNVDFNTTSGPSYAGAGGIGFYPFGNWNFFSYPSFLGDQDTAGDIFMNSQFQNGDGTVAYGTLLHEIGHAIGLKHPTEVVTDFAANPTVTHDQVLSADDPALTIMATVGDGGAGAAHLRALDKQAAAFIYGAAGPGAVYTASASGTDSVSAWSWNAGTQTLTQTAVSSGETIRGSSANDVITGSAGNDRLFGLEGTNLLIGNAGNDSLFGGTGVNTLVGGIGDDSYYVSSTATTITENPGEGTDSVSAFVSFTLPANVESLSLYGQELTGTSNNVGGSLFGDGAFATTLNGGTGADYIVGGAGADMIAGGGGIDLMFGNGGADHFIFRAVGDAPVGVNKTTIGDFTPADDRLDLSAIKTNGGHDLTFIGSAAFSGAAGQVHQTSSGGVTIIEGDVNGDSVADFQIQLNGAPSLQSSNFIFAVACYRAGTRILTDRGEIAVEALAAGDLVVTVSGKTAPITWIGQRDIDCARHPAPSAVWPVRVMAGAFADGVPRRDLFLSPDHAVFVEGMLVPIRHLVNDTSIARVAVSQVSYFHIALPAHDVILAEGLAAESWLDTGNRGMFANAGAPVALHPMLDDGPFVTDAARVEPIREALAARSVAMGVVAVDPSLDGRVRVVTEHGEIAPASSRAGRYVFVLPKGTQRVRLGSGWAWPAAFAVDQRRLGVCVSRIVLHDADGPRDLALDDPGLVLGWWAPEGSHRWTDGNAMLPVPPCSTMLEVQIVNCALAQAA